MNTLSREAMQAAFEAKDPGYDGLFYVAVRTTGVFCRPSCPSRPKAENVEFYATTGQALRAGYRPCKRCRPMESAAEPPEWLAPLLQRLEAEPEARVGLRELRAMGLSPERVRRWFVQHHGLTFAQWSRGRRLASAFTRLRQGQELDDVVFGSAYGSHSGFRSAFGKTFGTPPGRVDAGKGFLAARFVATPLGDMLAVAVDQPGLTGLCLLEFADRRMLETNLAVVRRRFGLAVLPGSNAVLDTLEKELRGYFGGRLREFSTPLLPVGTPFQEAVWAQLRRIPYGATISYEELARRLGNPAALRAVARANGANRIAILVPCHRVVGKDGRLTGYGGGLWRKGLLLDLEQGRPRTPAVG